MVGEALQRDTGNFYYLNCDGFTGVYIFLKTDQIIHLKYIVCLLYVHFMSIRLLNFQITPSKQNCLQNHCPHGSTIFHSASEAFTESLIKNVEITVAGLLLYPLSS